MNPPLVTMLIGLAGLALLGRGAWLLRKTTLLAPALWAALALLALMACQWAIARAGSAPAWWEEPLRLAAAVATFCPLMAVLGAKRPQHSAWQFIVASLWGLLAMPAGEAVLFRPGQPLHVAGAWNLMISILLGVGLINYLPTRYWAAGLVGACGQWILLADLLNWPHPPLGSWTTAAGSAALVGSLAMVQFALWQHRRRKLAPLDRVWLDFRDAFGVSWGYRVLQRLRETAQLSDWPLEPTWHGFLPASGGLPQHPGLGSEREAGHHAVSPPASHALPVPGLAPSSQLPCEARIEQTLRTLLRRFVSSDWIADRLLGS